MLVDAQNILSLLLVGRSERDEQQQQQKKSLTNCVEISH